MKWGQPRDAGLLGASGKAVRDACVLLAHAPARTQQEVQEMKAAAELLNTCPELSDVSVHNATTAVLDLAAQQGVRPRVRQQAFLAIAQLLAAAALAGGSSGKGSEDGSAPVPSEAYHGGEKSRRFGSDDLSI